MDEFLIRGGVPLRGEVTPSGNKNAALPLLAACLLTEEPVILRNLPSIRDVEVMLQLIESVGARVEKIEAHAYRIHAKTVEPSELTPDLCRQIRASILLAGPVTARAGELYLPPPGGDIIGRRRVDTHILALQALGAHAHYKRENRMFHFRADGLTGADFILDETSVTGTENAIMAAVTAKGRTIIRNAASEPHVQELCNFLNLLGARIGNVGSNTLVIDGVERLEGGDYTIGPDYLEVVSFIGAAAVTGGSIRIRQAGSQYLRMVELVFNRLGVGWEMDGEDLIIPENQRMEIEPDYGNVIPEISVMPWPAFPTDLVSIAIVMATQARGIVLFHDWMFEGRMYFTDKLRGMGAQIVLCDPHRCIVQGPSRLVGETVESPDIRAGLALVLAALAAEGESIIRNVGQIDRGYERIDEKLKALGADLVRR
ncbi:MAG TPA: UDP-N-acetylglucosamine 1-carboxyvinyltransferase [Anaerolineales bacterium]|nr:UDP-N-acetylglucosamine 1-carboxyvinyltransferase [Anaerolineales bacterium]